MSRRQVRFYTYSLSPENKNGKYVANDNDDRLKCKENDKHNGGCLWHDLVLLYDMFLPVAFFIFSRTVSEKTSYVH